MDESFVQSLIEHQPEVRSYLDGQAQRWCKEEDFFHRSPDEALHTIEVDVGESGKVRVG